jgi:hypothetical protein
VWHQAAVNVDELAGDPPGVVGGQAGAVEGPLQALLAKLFRNPNDFCGN